MSASTDTARKPVTMYFVIAALVAVAFFASYRLAIAGTAPADDSSAITTIDSAQPFGAVASSEGGCSCCGTASTGESVEGAAVLEADGVQRIFVDATNGYDPNVIALQAGVPAEITFSEGYGCMAEVVSPALGFYADLQSGPVTISLDPLEAGTYGFSCGMEMVFGEIVVQ